jgi:Holliday junction resolvasome RuvABC ATP-dependent DNA helicase subunit
MYSLSYKQNIYTPSFNPDYLNGIIGQKSAIQQLKFFGEFYIKNGNFPTILMKGSHGLGKTFLSKKVSESLNRKFIDINCSSLTEEAFMNVFSSCITSDFNTTVLMDESHELDDKIATILLSVLSPSQGVVRNIYFNGTNVEYDSSRFNFIFATTDSYKMIKPLVNRCREINLELYSVDEIYNILMLYTHDLSMEISIVPDVISSCRGRARNAYLVSQDLIAMSNDGHVGKEAWDKYVKIFNVYPMGLNKPEIDFMNILKTYGELSLANIAKKMGLNKNNIESDLEIRPIELGFVETTSKGRGLTISGDIYIENLFSKRELTS